MMGRTNEKGRPGSEAASAWVNAVNLLVLDGDGEGVRMRKRCIWTDKQGIRNPYAWGDLEDGVYANVGPIDSHVAEPEFQDAVALVCIEANHRNGTLTEPKYSELKARLAERRA